MFLNAAGIKTLCLDGSRIIALFADSVRITGNLYLRNDFRVDSGVNLRGAQISSNVECDKARFENPKGIALNANGAHIGGSVFLREGFNSEGEVNVTAAVIGMALTARGHALSTQVNQRS
jgi:hypothetical protein